MVGIALPVRTTVENQGPGLHKQVFLARSLSSLGLGFVLKEPEEKYCEIRANHRLAPT